MIDHTHYVPILRRRAAEVAAVTNLLNEDFANITPFFELCEHILTPEKREKLLRIDSEIYFYEVIKELAGCCEFKPYFIDFGYVEGLFSRKDNRHMLEVYFDLLDHHHCKAIPVTGLSRSDSYQNGISQCLRRWGTGMCLRLTQRDIREPTFVLRLNMLLRNFDIGPRDVDLLVDLGIYRDSNPSYEEISDRIPMLREWKSFIVACGSFPEDLSDLAKNDEHKLPRSDWQRWLDLLMSQSRPRRIPTFADYTIQFPRRPEPLSFIPRTSASIRYTARDHWVVMRGEWLNNPHGAGFDQYWGLANSLMSRPEYSGEDFSFGDQYIARIGSQNRLTGNISTWLQAGLNRHMTLTVRQISQAISSAKFGQQSLRPLQRFPLRPHWNERRLVLPASHHEQYMFPPEAWL